MNNVAHDRRMLTTRSKTLLLAFCTFTALVALTNTASAQVSAPRPGHLKLLDPLDRPQDGYCLDVVGSGQYIRFDLPATAHNCKPGLYADEAVILEPNGYIRFPAYNKCLTAAGINGRALPGAALVPRDCNEQSPFLKAHAQQLFTFRPNGYVELTGSGLCLTVSNESDSTFEPTHRWRPLFLGRCDEVDPSRSRWHFTIPQ
jgi:hypothetical protein